MKVAPATLSDRDAKRIATEMLRPMNQGLETIGSAMLFGAYVEGTYRSAALPLLASTTRNNYEYVLGRYLLPMFSSTSLRDLRPLMLQRYFSSLKVSHASASKIKDVLASVMGSAVRFGVVLTNPLTGVQLVPSRTGQKTKPTITPEQFGQLVDTISEPYSTMVYVCVLAGLRVSELVALKWEDVHTDSITIDERFCRGDWGCPKTTASGATIGVDESVVLRIQQLKGAEVTINWGAKGKKTFKLVSNDAPHDLVFQSLRNGSPMSDHNILVRHIKPAGRKLGVDLVNWQVLRRSYATWLVQAGADPKAVQGLMRHSRISTTMDIYAQFVPESQRSAVVRVMDMVTERQMKAAEAKCAAIN
jgi:integrase